VLRFQSTTKTAILSALLGISAGCSGQSTFLTGGPTVGQLKTSLSHLEYENQQLKQRTAKLEKETRSMESRLVQEELNNGDLTARLDDARNLLRDRGIESDIRLGSRPRGQEVGVGDEEQDSRARTTQTGRSTKQRRKPPFAQISNGPGDSRSADDDDSTAQPRSRQSRDSTSVRSRRHSDADLDRQSSRDNSKEGTPIASANDDSTIEIR
jgi:hypothetical protein